MSYFRMCALSFAVLVTAGGLCASNVGNSGRELVPTTYWYGSVDNEAVWKEVNCVTSELTLARLWRDWGITEPMPVIDFNREVALVITGTGSILRFERITLDEFGNVDMSIIQTADLVTGFRYALATVPREGIRSVRGKELPKDIMLIANR